MKKNILKFWMLAAVVVLGLASCSDKDDFTHEGVEVAEQPDMTQPTEDQMTTVVKAQLSAVVPTAFDEGSTGAAFVKRFPQVSTEFGPDTRMVILNGSDFSMSSSAPTARAEYMEEVVRQYLNGGYICLVRPNAEQTALFMFAAMVSAMKIESDELVNQFELDESVAARVAQNSNAVERMKTRAKNIQAITTRAGGDSSSDEPIAELYILGPTDYFVQEPLLDEFTAYTHTEDGDGNQTPQETITTKTERTPYISGLLADAAAEWINNVEENAEKSPRYDATRATRGNDATTAINEMMDACETLTYNGAISWKTWQNELQPGGSRVNMIVRSWGIHNMQTNKDYYYIKQDVKLKMQGIFTRRETARVWGTTSYFGLYNYWYGSFLSNYVTSMNLTGNGNIFLEASSPNTDNASGTTSISTGSSSSKTETAGISWGAAIGSSPSFNFGGDYSLGYTTGTSFSMSSSTNYNDLKVVKNTLGNTEVKWTYTGKLPEYYFDQQSKYNCHQTAADILVNDCDVSNQICWSVSNPSEQYTLNITSTPQTAMLLMSNIFGSSGDRPHRYEYCTSNQESYSHTLLEPNRAMQKWRMSVTVDEWVDKPVTGAEGQLAKNLQDQFPVLYKPLFEVADKTPESLNTINFIIENSKKVFNDNKSVLTSFAIDLGIKRYSIHWHCDSEKITARSIYTVDASWYLQESPQLLWCPENSTLYFVYTKNLEENSTWDGHNVSRMASNSTLENSSKTNSPVWNRNWKSASQVTRIVFDKSFVNVRPTSCYGWFHDFKNLKTVEGLEYLNTSEVTTMAYMFQNCESLVSLNVDEFDMSKVNNIQHMFENCKSLTTIYCRQTWNVRLSGSMFINCNNLVGAVRYNEPHFGGTMANPITGYFTMPPLLNVPDVYLKDNSQSNSSMLKPYEGQMVNVRYSRKLSATQNADGTYTPSPWTVCLPYDLNLSDACNKGQVKIYTLAAVEDGQFVFKKLNVTKLTGGEPYVLIVNSGTLSLSAMNVRITASTPKKIPVYSSVANWQQRKGTPIGEWMGTFDYKDSDEGAAFDAFVMQSKDFAWHYFDPNITTASIPAFRAFLSAPTLENKTYRSKYED